MYAHFAQVYTISFNLCNILYTKLVWFLFSTTHRCTVTVCWDGRYSKTKVLAECLSLALYCPCFCIPKVPPYTLVHTVGMMPMFHYCFCCRVYYDTRVYGHLRRGLVSLLLEREENQEADRFCELNPI